MRRAAVLAVVLLGAAAGCHHGHAPGPADAFVRFVGAAGRGDQATAWGLLSSETREAAEQLGARQSPPVSGRSLLLGGGLEFTHGLADVSVVSRAGDAAVLSVTADDGSKRQVTLHREDGAWKVVLPLP